MPVVWFGCAAAVLLLHFFSSFYVPQSSDARDQQLPVVKPVAQLKPYDYQTVLTQIEQLVPPRPNEDMEQNAQESQSVPDRFDSWQTEGQSVALMAIYQQQHATALFWLKTKAAAAELVRLKQGEQHQGLSVIELTATTATLQLEQQQRTLRLFTPGDQLKQHNNQDSEN